MSSGLDTERLGGRVNIAAGQLLTSDDWNRTGGIAMAGLLNLLALVFHDDYANVPRTGFPMGKESADHCKVTATGNLTFSVSSGVGLFYDASPTTDEFGPNQYLPIVVESAVSGALDAHDANPRIDLVCLAPSFVDDESENRLVKDPLNPNDPATSVSTDTRTRWSHDLQVVKGTPAATPSAPAVPGGYVEIARATVPASSGAAVWEDTRPPLVISNALAATPFHAGENYVIGGHPGTGTAAYDSDDSLEVTPSSPASLTLQVAKGRCVQLGRTIKVNSGSVTLNAAHATNPRIDLIYVDVVGGLSKSTGTAGPTPSAPTPPADAVPLAYVTVAAAVTAIDADDIEDLREFGPIGSTQLRTAAVEREKIADAAVGNDQVEAGSLGMDRLDTDFVRVSTGLVTVSTDTATIPTTIRTIDDRDTGSSVSVEVELFEIGAVTSSSGDFDQPGTENIDTYAEQDAGGGTFDAVLGFGTNCALTAGRGQTGPLFARRMYVTITADTAGQIKVHRRDNTVTGSWLVAIRPTSHVGRPGFVVVTFT